VEKYATFWRRFWAAIADALLFWPLGWVDEWVWGATSSTAILVPWYVVYSVSFVAYSIVLHGLYGQTLGKALMGVKVVDLSEGRLSMTQAVLRDSFILVLTAYGLAVGLRAVAAGISPYDGAFELGIADWVFVYANLGWFLLELVTMLFNRKRRAIHDFIAGSVVIRLERAAAGERKQPPP
jgi:uncharacterized RDD family membrane protein YckC